LASKEFGNPVCCGEDMQDTSPKDTEQ